MAIIDTKCVMCGTKLSQVYHCTKYCKLCKVISIRINCEKNYHKNIEAYKRRANKRKIIQHIKNNEYDMLTQDQQFSECWKYAQHLLNTS